MSRYLRNATIALALQLTAVGTTLAGPLASQTPGTWSAFASSQLQSVGPSALPDGYLNAVMIAWSGGVYDSDRDQLVVWGGGHTDYAGNEVYAFGPITGSSPSWTRLTNPSNPPAVNTQYASDGRPVSRHSYNLLTYLPAPANKMMSCAIGSQYNNGGANTAVDFYDFTVDGMSGQPWTRGPNPVVNEYAIGGLCVRHPATGEVWFHDASSNNSRLQKWSPATNSWTAYAQFFLPIYYTAAIDPVRNLLVAAGGGNVRVWDLSNPSAASYVATTTGPSDMANSNSPGFEYDSVNQRFVSWNGGATVYTLTPPSTPTTGTWVWATIPLDSSNTVTPTPAAGVLNSGSITGTFGRMRYIPSAQGIVAVSQVSESVYFFKLPNAGGSGPPTITLSASPTTVTAGNSTTLSWSVTGATSCTASGGWTGSEAMSGSQASVALNATTTFTLTCTGAGGQTNRSVTVTVPAASVPSVSLAASPTSIAAGGSSTLTWSSSNVTSCAGSGGWSGSVSISGSQSTGALDGTTTYGLSCSGSSGSASASATVTVAAVVPTVKLSASPSSIATGADSMLTWSATNASSCTATGAWSGSKTADSSQSVGPLTSNSTFGLTCTGAGGSASASATVVVQNVTPPPTGGTGGSSGGGGGLDPATLAALASLSTLRALRRRRAA